MMQYWIALAFLILHYGFTNNIFSVKLNKKRNKEQIKAIKNIE